VAKGKLAFDSGFLAELEEPAHALRAIVRHNRGARIGESTVVSRKMHTIDPARPEVVTVLANVDAGRVFYHRQNAGEVFHLDVFHQCGRVDHRTAAAQIRHAMEMYGFHHSIYGSRRLGFAIGYAGVSADLVDVQTATGGGRVTGSLNYGRKLSLRLAHENHVHIAAMLPEEHAACLFYLVLAAEEAILAAGLELRRNEGIVAGQGGGGDADLSAYCDQTDSFLRQKDVTGSGACERQQYLQDVSDLVDDFDTVKDMKATLDEADGGAGEQKMIQSLTRRGSGEQALRRLERQGIVAVEGGKVRLTAYGQALKRYIECHMPDIEAYLRRAFRLFRPPVWRPGHGKLLAAGEGGTGPRRLKPREADGCGAGELAVAETVSAAARRAAAAGRPELKITADDLQAFVRRRKQKAEICLVIDASASMAGQRLRAAKFLARHLLLSTPDRLAIITFQECSAKVVLPLTRDWQQAEESLSEIVSFGSTPLAGGLKTCLAYLQGSGARNPLVILITDGIPTIAEQSRDPMDDALAAAAEVKESGFGFACIGLKPHRQYLNQLAERAGGSLYMLEELEKYAMVKAAWMERAGRYL
jgi:magnesium chelatase subunit D